MRLQGLCITTFLDGLGTPIFLSYLPQYLVEQLKFPVGAAAAIASLPLFASLSGNLLSGWIADWLIFEKGVSVLTVRKILYMGPRMYYAMCGLLLTMSPSPSLAVFIMISQNFADGLNGSGLWCSPFDITREYTGAVMGLMNMASNLTYYALSANIIGYLLDLGKCTTTPLPAVNSLATFVDPDNNSTMFLTVSGDCADAIQTCLADSEQAVIDDYRMTHEGVTEDPDIQTCKDMWEFLFLGSAALTLIASFCFAATASGTNMDHIFSGKSAPKESRGTRVDSANAWRANDLAWPDFRLFARVCSR